MSEALLALAAAHSGERVLDVGCGCRASTLDIARAVGLSGRVAALDISGPVLAEGPRRAEGRGIANVDWQEADPATAALGGYGLLVSKLRRDVLRCPGGGICPYAQRSQAWRADGVCILA